MVTHDRYFLDRVVNRIVELDRRQLVSYTRQLHAAIWNCARNATQRLAAEQKQPQSLAATGVGMGAPWRHGPRHQAEGAQAARRRIADHCAMTAAKSGWRWPWPPGGWASSVLTHAGLTKAYDGLTLCRRARFSSGTGGSHRHPRPQRRGQEHLFGHFGGQTRSRTRRRWSGARRCRWATMTSAARIWTMPSGLYRIYRRRGPADPHQRWGAGGGRPDVGVVSLSPHRCSGRRIGSLSGGERRRLYLLRTLIHQPNVLLFGRADQRSGHPDTDRAGGISGPLQRLPGRRQP